METELNGFDEFWSVYPRRVAKQAAYRAYKKALKETTPETIAYAARAYARERQGKDMEYTKHPATWLNAERWRDFQIASIFTDAEVVKLVSKQVYVPFNKRDAWDAYGLSIGKTYPRDRNGGWWFPSAEPPHQEAAE